MVSRNVTLFKLVLCAVSVSTCCKGDRIYVWGTEWQTGSPVIALITLPEAVVPGSGAMALLNYEVVDRGVTGIWQSSSGNFYYWKSTGLFKRTPEGVKSAVRFHELSPYENGVPVVESPNMMWLAGLSRSERNVGIIAFSRWQGVIWRGTDAYIGSAEAAYDDIAWLDGNHIIAREFVVDRLDRLQRSKLVIMSPVLRPEKVRLTNLPDSQLEIVYAISRPKVAFQIYDTTNEEFGIGLINVDDPLKKVKWLEFPLLKSGRKQRYSRMRVNQMEWSPKGDFLALRYGPSLVIWDANSERWLEAGKGHIATSADAFCWLDQNTILILTSIIAHTVALEFGPFFFVCNMGTFPIGGSEIGSIKGLTVSKIFTDAKSIQENTPRRP